MRRAILLILCPLAGLVVGLMIDPYQLDIILLGLCAGIVLAGVLLGFLERPN